MCGLVSIVRFAGLNDHERGDTLVKMRDALGHRGPDEASLEVIDDWVALGHRRLSILDIEGAKQPLRNEDNQICCVFNGEIYNFQALRERLMGLGHTFATRGDGEVIVHGYEQWGDEIATMLEGMFAFVLLDRRNRRVLVARDRVGIKPLFWTQLAGCVLVASEIKAILAHREVQRVASGLSMQLGLLRMHVPWPLTAFDGIYRLPPGAALILDANTGCVKVSRFAPVIVRRQPVEFESEDALLERAEHEVLQAISRQMVADVPVGAFLSGGIDSSLVVAFMRKVTTEPLHTFSIGVDRAKDDESLVARETARQLGTIHHEIRLESLRFEDLVDMPALYDEPFAETSALGVRALSRAAREHVKVVLTGDGGDEVFGGYDTYRWIRMAALGQRLLPEAVSRQVGQTALSKLFSGAPNEWIRRALRMLTLLGFDGMSAHRSLLASLAWSSDAGALALTERLSDMVRQRASRVLEGWSAARRALASDRLERLPNAMLTKVDIASMAASIEVRVPMLDDALIGFADRLPDRELWGFRRGKLLLRRLLERVLPSGPAWDKKRGFALPVDAWIDRCRPLVTELLHAHQKTLLSITRVDAVEAMRDFVGRSPRFSPPTAGMRLLWLATVALWAERFGIAERADGDELEGLVV